MILSFFCVVSDGLPVAKWKVSFVEHFSIDYPPPQRNGWVREGVPSRASSSCRPGRRRAGGRSLVALTGWRNVRLLGPRGPCGLKGVG